MNFGKIVVLMGGPSSEAEVSRRTGTAIYEALKTKNYDAETLELNPSTLVEDIKKSKCDVVFNAVHGKYGEDGYIAACLEMIDMPYTSCGVLSSAITMDKVVTKQVLQSCKLSTPKARFFTKESWQPDMADELIKEFGLPMVIKAASQGSSIGVEIVEAADRVLEAINSCFKYDDSILIEQFIKGRELSIPVYGNSNRKAWPIIEITTTTGRYDYASKYTKGQSTHIVPAPLAKDVEDRVKKLCVDACTVTNCRGVVRVDVMLAEDNTPYILEINTVPGMTETSLVPDSAAHENISFPELCEKILQMALE